jgi:alpha-amylase
MRSINLIFGCHSHQPVGNFDFVFEEAYHKSYLPFVQVLERYPAVKVTLHFTGPLWDWFLEHQPAFIQRIAALVQAGQVEVMGGAYYEPLLCAIPERDAIAQIRRMQDFCLAHLGKTPRGMWLTERVWEPHMARTLALAGVEYAALDDEHFLCSGLSFEDLFGYYMTEDEGHTLKIFPILKPLRYCIPFHPVEDTIAFLREHATEDGLACAVVHDDGEKFGVWPGTYDSVYRQGWLEDFFQALTDNMSWIKSVTYAEYLGKARARGRTYITCASYSEMMAWALPTDMQRRLHALQESMEHDEALRDRAGQFVRGGFWRGFLAKYPEANNLQKRMLRASDRLERLRQSHAGHPALAEAEVLLHKAQCNCAYWHGVFGGLYLNHLRTAVYQNTIACDAVLDAMEFGEGQWARCLAADMDADGNDEIILENDRLALFLSPTDGGTLFELDYKPQPFNFGNTLSRRPELYHDALREGMAQVGDPDAAKSIHDLVQAKEEGLEQYLVYDAYRRVSLRDHLFETLPTLEALVQGVTPDQGGFATAEYAVEQGDGHVVLRCEGHLHGRAVSLAKTLELAPGASSFTIRYDIRNHGETPLEVVLAFEFAVNLLTGSADDRYYRSEDVDLGRPMLGVAAVAESLRHLAFCDGWQRLECGLRLSEPATVYRFPIETVSQSEGGQERVYQGSIVLPCWTIHCPAQGEVSRSVLVELGPLDA